jgi:gamma-glutamyltranspeptidase
MLHQSVNAVDAALAPVIAPTVVEFTSTGIGADDFALGWDRLRPDILLTILA